MWFNYQISLQLGKTVKAMHYWQSQCMYFKNCCHSVNVIWNTLRFWFNNDNNDNIHAGAKFDVGGGAETSSLLTVALIQTREANTHTHTHTHTQNNKDKSNFNNED